MISIKIIIGILFLGTLHVAIAEEPPASASPAAPSAAASPSGKAEPVYTGEDAKLKTQVEALFDASRHVNLPVEKKKESRGRIANAIDWDRISKACLGDARWKKQSAGNRSSFQKLLREVIELTAYSRMDTFWKNATYQFEKVAIKKNEAQVQTRFKTDGDNFVLEYYMNRDKDTWRIYDIGFNQERYSVNIQDKIAEFLKEKSFSELLTSLKKRKEELEENTTPTPKKS